MVLPGAVSRSSGDLRSNGNEYSKSWQRVLLASQKQRSEEKQHLRIMNMLDVIH